MYIIKKQTQTRGSINHIKVMNRKRTKEEKDFKKRIDNFQKELDYEMELFNQKKIKLHKLQFEKLREIMKLSPK